MELKTFITVVRARWRLIVVVTLSTVLLGSIASLTTTRSYSSSTQLFVSVSSIGSSDAGDLVQGSSAAQAKVRSYVSVVTSGRVLEPVIADLGLDTTPAGLAAEISASSPVNTSLIDISVTDPDPAQAARLTGAVAASFEKVVEEQLERPVGGGSGLVTVESLDSPAVPTRPTNPKPVLWISLAFAVGVLSGTALALLRDTLDTRIRSKADVEEVTDAPVLGGIGFHPRATTAPLVVDHAPRSPLAESYRALRTSLQFVTFEGHGRTLVVTSAMPGEGKSTTAANLAVCLAETGASVLLVDADLRRPRIAEIMGLEGAVGLTDLLVGRAELVDAVQPWGDLALHVLPSGTVPPNPSELLGSLAMASLVSTVEVDYDFVVIDTPPLLPVTDAAVLSRCVSGVIVATAAQRSSRHQLKQALAAISEIGSRTVGIVLTMAPMKGLGAYGYGEYGGYHVSIPESPASASTATAG
ncbi:polysaccharide biosynthesis tyrosine autokinase [Frigoribacterium sp. PhB24]|uniref:polysaccharide biosynthesis tyrosine autokinase n=1 Tax=Frigoribacterium sp. PhB24 TaxID=2485204 RepID=UPI000F48001B|nr:polysaccharide biosynthesis tyrosine autokinase [Frigoribacterium sp. PhB24]ROS47970.1 capsular exopolysaccharide synthesis family protein [Frigoribacterium sp. PhB24]